MLNTLLLVLAFIVMSTISFLVFYFMLKQSNTESLAMLEKKDKAGLKKLKKDLKQDKLTMQNILMSKWVAFGGGFYGLMAVLTYVVVEFNEIVDFLTSESGVLATLAAMGVSDLVGFFINSIMNFVTAITWPVYWMKIVEGYSPWVWFLVVYLAYVFGQYIAKNIRNPLEN
jgi:hypothetical protein